jgi:hypothetical protein
MYTIDVDGQWQPGRPLPYMFGRFGGLLLRGRDLPELLAAVDVSGLSYAVDGDTLVLNFDAGHQAVVRCHAQA